MHIEKYTYMVLKAEPVWFIPHCSIAELVLTYTGWDMNVRSLVPEPMRLIPTLCGLPSRYRASPQTVSPVQHGCSTHIFSWQPAITSASNVTPTSVPFHQNLSSALHSKKVPSTGVFWWLFIGDKMILNIGLLLRNPSTDPLPKTPCHPSPRSTYLLLWQNITKCLSEPRWQVLSMSCSHPQAFLFQCTLPTAICQALRIPPPPLPMGFLLQLGHVLPPNW